MNWPDPESLFRLKGRSLAQRLLGKGGKKNRDEDSSPKDSASTRTSSHRSESVDGVPVAEKTKVPNGASVPVRAIRVFGATKA